MPQAIPDLINLVYWP